MKILHFKQFYKHYVINEDGTEGTEKELSETLGKKL